MVGWRRGERREKWAGVGGKASMCLCHKRFLITILLLFPLLFFLFCFVSFRFLFFFLAKGRRIVAQNYFFPFLQKVPAGKGRRGGDDFSGVGVVGQGNKATTTASTL